MSARTGDLSGGGMVGFAVRRPVTIFVGILMVTLFGVLAGLELPVQITPDIETPTLSISTAWPGASPTEIETQIVEPQEAVLKLLPGLDRMSSQSRLGSGSITLELEVGVPLDEALVRVTNLLSQVKRYPTNARQPVVTTANSEGPPVIVITLSAANGSDVEAYRSWVAERVEPELARVRGVAEVRVVGGRERQLEVDYDPAALAGRGLTISGLSRIVQGELEDISAGDISVGKRRYLVRTPLQPDPPEALGQVIVATKSDGTAIKLSDVATVRLGLRKPDAHVLADGVPALAFLISREPGSNILDVTRGVKAAVERLQTEVVGPRGLELRVVSDQAGYIETSLALVERSLLLGGLLTALVLMAFLRSVRAALLVSLAVPVCTLATSLGMWLMGRTLNVVSLAGAAFAIGMVVDNSIVVLENIDTWRKRGVPAREAAVSAGREVFGALVASTATTVVVFIPIIAWTDEVGQLLEDIAVAITFAVGSSIFVAVLALPSFAALIYEGTQAGPSARGRFRIWLHRSVHTIGATPRVAVAVCVFAFGLSAIMVKAYLPPFDYLPAGTRGFVFGMVIPPPGYTVEEMERIGHTVQSQIVPHIGKDKDGVPAVDRTFFAARPDGAFMGAGVVDQARVQELANHIRSVLGRIPGVIGFANPAGLFGRNVGGGRAIDIELAGPDLGAIAGVGGRMMGAIMKELPGAQARPIPALDSGAPELHVVPRREELAALGLSSPELGLIVDTLVDGALIGEMGMNGEPKVDVVLRANQGLLRVVDIGAAPVGGPSGKIVPLEAVAQLRQAMGPTVIQRIERRRAITIQVTPPEKLPLETAMAQLSQLVSGMRERGEIPDTIDTRLAGTAGRLADAKPRFINVLLLASLICFLLMASLYEDFLAPTAVITVLPLAAAGGLFFLHLVNQYLAPQPLDLMTAIGFVILVGTAVNNAILVVNGAVERLRAGQGLADALADSVEGRLRPIAMTTVTTLVGLGPLVVSPGAGSELYRGVGAIVLGGLAFSTMLTVFVVPAVFTLLSRLRMRR
ncbi:MAG: efflux RND transporter permease subunit [Deltaproteobacteria bacterium]|nr:efflux RND transporter permease subunit [Deltaproteobacteria bacterium]